MDKTAFEKYLNDRYYEQMNYYDKASGKNQKKFKQFQWTLIILSALTPVVAALNELHPVIGGYKVNLSPVLIAFSSIVAILTTGIKTFNYQELWATYRTTHEKLKPEIHYYNFNVGEYATAGIDKESLFVSRVEAILDSEHTQWPPAKKGEEQPGKKEGGGDTQKNQQPS